MKRLVFICILVSFFMLSIVAQPNLWVQHYDRNNGGLNENVYDLRQDESGLIWITTYGGLYSYDGQRFILHPDSIVKKPISGYHWRPQTPFEQTCYDIAQKENWQRGGKERILCSLEDSDGNLWMGCSNGLRLCRKSEYPFHVVEFDEEVLCLFQGKGGEIWMTTREGAVCLLDQALRPIAYLTKEGEWTRQKTYCGLVVMNIYEDPDGFFWLSARHEGLIRLQKRDLDIKNGFHVFQIKNDSDSNGGIHTLNNVYSVCLDRNNRLWTASLKTGPGIITKLNPQIPNDIINLNALLKRANRQTLPESIRCFLPLYSDEWLVGSDNGLFYMKPSTWNRNEIGIFRQLEKDKTGSLKNYAAQCLLCDHDGYIYIGTSGHGLMIINKAETIGKSLEYRLLSMETGFLSSNVVYALTEDRKHSVWGFCDKGLFKIISDKNNKAFNHLYTAIYGEEYSSSWPAMSLGNGLRLKDGRIIKGTRKGLFWFQADSVGNRKSQHNIFVEARYRIGNRDTSFVSRDTIILPKGTKDLSLYCSVLDYNRLSNITYAYRIANRDTVWTYTTNPFIELQGLSSGYLTLEIRATNGDGIWSGNERTITLHASSYDYLIISLAAIFVAVLGIMMYFIGKRHTHHNNEERTPNVLDPILNNLPTRDVVDEQFKSDLRKNIVNHIDDTEYSADLLAKDMGMSKNTLTSRIKRIYGIFPVELINRIRIQAATELLTQTELTISEIAYRVGFNDPKYFSRVYKKMTGFSPTGIRTKNGSRQHALQD